MENWKTEEIILVARQAGCADKMLSLRCEKVSWQPPAGIPPARDNGTEPGMLCVTGVDPAPLADVSWAPTHVRFTAQGYMEPREFNVTGWQANPDARTLTLAIP